MRMFAVMMTFVILGAMIPVVASAQTPRIAGRVLVVFSEGVWNRTEAVANGVEDALGRIPGVTVLIPARYRSDRSGIDPSGVDYVVEIVRAEVEARNDENQSIYLPFSNFSISAYGTKTTVVFRLGLRFLRPSGNSQYFELAPGFGIVEARGAASGYTYILGSIAGMGYSVSRYEDLEREASRNAATAIFSRFR